ncbi:sigma-70 family RNA polymerase sigma factor [Amycolatopsis sp.]|uniref:sigma-70 family RNA polymerase sigma factor n=1 Tax=Amycolatopsis sp. TaxID=37632 RepID=UPI002C75707A|nr:sigma-70 family RNA polymerase sigma factor [Amycolatopsis sp.]HVV11781.1 sigma-70 family RNA polymerase sigma factor [Amycolatopsis sp.]
MPTTSPEAFAELTDRYRPELLAYCYRMLGSVDESEDVVQDTYLRAWRFFDQFEGRSSVRLWLYRIATTTCLNALRSNKRRPLPSGLSAPSDTGGTPLAPAESEVPWLQPAPDSILYASAADPGVVVPRRNSVRLAFVAALQHLSARQRAVLVLRDVLGWKAKEVAQMLESSTTAVNSALQRARIQLADAGPMQDELSEPAQPELRTLLDRYVAAFEHADVAGLAELLRADVELEMPPVPTWFTGRDAVSEFLARVVLRAPGQWRALPTRANGDPAVALYGRAPDGTYRANGIDVLSLIGGRIARIVAFNDAALVKTFGFPEVLASASAP